MPFLTLSLPVSSEIPLDRRSPGSSDLLLWQLIDSAFPASGFAHSGGLEAAMQHGEVAGRTDLLHFIEHALQQVGRGSLPFASSAHKNPETFHLIDRYCEAFISNHVTNRASKLQGRAFLASSIRIFPADDLQILSRNISDEKLPNHFAPVFGCVLSALGVCHETASRGFLFTHLRSLVSSAVRLGIVGPLEGQGIQYQMSDYLERIRNESNELDYKNAAQTAPLFELWQGNQDRLYSRLFQS